MKTVAELMKALDPETARVLGLVRRMAVRITAKALWQLVGFTIDGQTEVPKAELFGGIGIHARPPAGGKPEAIVVMVGGADHPTIIAVRDEKTRAAIAGALKPDESMLFNSRAVVYLKEDRTIEARGATPLGTVEPLVKATTYLAAESTVLTALSAYATAVIAQNAADVILGDPDAIAVTSAATALVAAIATFIGAGSAAFRTTVVKGE